MIVKKKKKKKKKNKNMIFNLLVKWFLVWNGEIGCRDNKEWPFEIPWMENKEFESVIKLNWLILFFVLIYFMKTKNKEKDDWFES